MGWAPQTLHFYLEPPRPTIYKWLFQLDDEPNLYIENGYFTKHPFINGCLGFQVGIFVSSRLRSYLDGTLQ